MSDKIKNTIAALLAKAKGTDNENEAEVFLAKAEELLERHQLSLSDIDGASDPVIHSQGRAQAAGSHVWRNKLYFALASYYGCKTVLSREYGRRENGSVGHISRMEVVGRESAIVTLDLMFPWIAEQVSKQGREISKITGMSPQGQAKRVGAALNGRIWRLIREREAAEKAGLRTEAATKNALATTCQVAAKADAVWGTDLKTGRSGRAVSDRLSREAANAIGLHRQTGGGSQLKLGGK